jgi:hypothetical protein
VKFDDLTDSFDCKQMNSEEGKDEPPGRSAVTEEASSAVSALGETADSTPFSEASVSLDPMTTRKRKRRPAKKKHGTRDESKPSHPLSA